MSFSVDRRSSGVSDDQSLVLPPPSAAAAAAAAAAAGVATSAAPLLAAAGTASPLSAVALTQFDAFFAALAGACAVKLAEPDELQNRDLERTIDTLRWGEFPRHEQFYQEALVRLGELARLGALTALVQLFLELVPASSAAYARARAGDKSFVAPAQGSVAEPVHSMGTLADIIDRQSLVVSKVPQWRSTPRLWHNFEVTVQLVVADGLVSVLQSYAGKGLDSALLAALRNTAFQSFAVGKPVHGDREAALVQLAPALQQWCAVLGLLTPHHLSDVVDDVRRRIESPAPKVTQEEQNYVAGVLAHVRVQSSDAGDADTAALLALVGTAWKAIKKSRPQLLDAYVNVVRQVTLADGHHAALAAPLAALGTESDGWVKRDELQRGALALQAVLVVRQPRAAYEQAVELFVRKVCKLAWNERSRDDALHSLLVLLQGDAPCHATGWLPDYKWLPAVAEDALPTEANAECYGERVGNWQSRVPLPSAARAYEHVMRADDPEHAAMQRLQTIVSELVTCRKVLPRLAESASVLADLIVQMAAHSLPFVRTSVLHHIFTERIAVHELVSAGLRALCTILNPHSGFQQYASRSLYHQKSGQQDDGSASGAGAGASASAASALGVPAQALAQSQVQVQAGAASPAGAAGAGALAQTISFTVQLKELRKQAAAWLDRVIENCQSVVGVPLAGESSSLRPFSPLAAFGTYDEGQRIRRLFPSDRARVLALKVWTARQRRREERRLAEVESGASMSALAAGDHAHAQQSSQQASQQAQAPQAARGRRAGSDVWGTGQSDSTSAGGDSAGMDSAMGGSGGGSARPRSTSLSRVPSRGARPVKLDRIVSLELYKLALQLGSFLVPSSYPDPQLAPLAFFGRAIVHPDPDVAALAGLALQGVVLFNPGLRDLTLRRIADMAATLDMDKLPLAATCLTHALGLVDLWLRALPGERVATLALRSAVPEWLPRLESVALAALCRGDALVRTTAAHLLVAIARLHEARVERHEYPAGHELLDTRVGALLHGSAYAEEIVQRARALRVREIGGGVAPVAGSSGANGAGDASAAAMPPSMAGITPASAFLALVDALQSESADVLACVLAVLGQAVVSGGATQAVALLRPLLREHFGKMQAQTAAVLKSSSGSAGGSALLLELPVRMALVGALFFATSGVRHGARAAAHEDHVALESVDSGAIAQQVQEFATAFYSLLLSTGSDAEWVGTAVRVSTLGVHPASAGLVLGALSQWLRGEASARAATQKKSSASTQALAVQQSDTMIALLRRMLQAPSLASQLRTDAALLGLVLEWCGAALATVDGAVDVARLPAFTDLALVLEFVAAALAAQPRTTSGAALSVRYAPLAIAKTAWPQAQRLGALRQMLVWSGRHPSSAAWQNSVGAAIDQAASKVQGLVQREATKSSAQASAAALGVAASRAAQCLVQVGPVLDVSHVELDPTFVQNLLQWFAQYGHVVDADVAARCPVGNNPFGCFLTLNLDEALLRRVFSLVLGPAAAAGSGGEAAAHECFLAVCDLFVADDEVLPAPETTGVRADTLHHFDRLAALAGYADDLPPVPTDADRRFAEIVDAEGGTLLQLGLHFLTNVRRAVRARAFDLLVRLAGGLAPASVDVDLQQLRWHRDAFRSQVTATASLNCVHVSALVAAACSRFVEDVFNQVLQRSASGGFARANRGDLLSTIEYLLPWCDHVRLVAASAPGLPGLRLGAPDQFVNAVVDLTAPLFSDASNVPQEVMLLWQRLARAGRVSDDDMPNLRVIMEAMLGGPPSRAPLYKNVVLALFRIQPAATAQLLVQPLSASALAAAAAVAAGAAASSAAPGDDADAAGDAADAAAPASAPGTLRRKTPRQAVSFAQDNTSALQAAQLVEELVTDNMDPFVPHIPVLLSSALLNFNNARFGSVPRVVLSAVASALLAMHARGFLPYRTVHALHTLQLLFKLPTTRLQWQGPEDGITDATVLQSFAAGDGTLPGDASADEQRAHQAQVLSRAPSSAVDVLDVSVSGAPSDSAGAGAGAGAPRLSVDEEVVGVQQPRKLALTLLLPDRDGAVNAVAVVGALRAAMPPSFVEQCASEARHWLSADDLNVAFKAQQVLYGLQPALTRATIDAQIATLLEIVTLASERTAARTARTATTGGAGAGAGAGTGTGASMPSTPVAGSGHASLYANGGGALVGALTGSEAHVLALAANQAVHGVRVLAQAAAQLSDQQALHTAPNLFWAAAALLSVWRFPHFQPVYNAAVELMSHLVRRYNVLHQFMLSPQALPVYEINVFRKFSANWTPAFVGVLPALLPVAAQRDVSEPAVQLLVSLLNVAPHHSWLVDQEARRTPLTTLALLPYLTRAIGKAALTSSARRVAEELAAACSRERVDCRPAEAVLRQYASGTFGLDAVRAFVDALVPTLITSLAASDAPALGALFEQQFAAGDAATREVVLWAASSVLCSVSGAQFVAALVGLLALASSSGSSGVSVVAGVASGAPAVAAPLRTAYADVSAAFCRALSTRGDVSALQRDSAPLSVATAAQASLPSLTGAVSALGVVVDVWRVSGDAYGPSSGAVVSAAALPSQASSAAGLRGLARVTSSAAGARATASQQPLRTSSPLQPIGSSAAAPSAAAVAPAQQQQPQRAAPTAAQASAVAVATRPSTAQQQAPASRASTAMGSRPTSGVAGAARGVANGNASAHETSSASLVAGEVPSLTRLLHDGKLRSFFQQFVENNFDSDGLNFYNAVRDYTQETSVSKAALKAKVIIERFISPDSFDTVTIADSTRAEILRAYEASLPGPPPVTLFQRAAEEIKNALATDVYPHFAQSREYADMVDSGVV